MLSQASLVLGVEEQISVGRKRAILATPILAYSGLKGPFGDLGGDMEWRRKNVWGH